MRRVVLVRHAEPLVADGTPPSQWPLTEQGRDDATVLGRRLADGSATTTVWTSPERKTCETAALAFPSAPTRVREQLSEVKRAWYATPDDLAQAAASYLRGEVVGGWERRDDVIARLAPLQADVTPGARLVVVSHGMLLTTWLDHELGLEDPMSFWSNLQMPDAWELDLEEKSLQRIT
ncbi:MAG TPA: histidine phosphatase family protein [Acidimicrobiales bacterium]|nr:histidine phosphatase family protein [Acidimicrobiales bacterium]